jgi:hypothetical protein
MDCILYSSVEARDKDLRRWWAVVTAGDLSDTEVDALAALRWKLCTTKRPNIVHDATRDSDKGIRARKNLALGLELHPLPFHTEEKALDFVQEVARRVVADHGLGEELAALITEIDNLLAL